MYRRDFSKESNVLRHDGGALLWDEFHAVKRVWMVLWDSMIKFNHLNNRRDISKNGVRLLQARLDRIKFPPGTSSVGIKAAFPRLGMRSKYSISHNSH